MKIKLVLFTFLLFQKNIYSQWVEEWVKSYSYPNFTESQIKLDKDPQGNIYMTSSHRADFHSLNSHPSFSLRKLDPSGSELWFYSGKAFITGIDFDNNSNVYVSGIYTDSVSVFGSTLISKGGSDIYIAKLSSTGNLLWIKSFGGPEDDEAGGLKMNDEKIFVVGSVRKDADFNDTIISGDNRCKPFVSTFDTHGNLLAIKTWGTNLYYSSDTVYSNVKLVEPNFDQNGNIFAILKLCSTAVGIEGDSIYGGQNPVDYDYYLVKIDMHLNIVKTGYLGSRYEHDYWDLTFDKNYNPYLLESWEHNAGSGNIIVGYDSLFNKINSISVPTMFDGETCYYVAKYVRAITFDHNNNPLVCTYDLCDSENSKKNYLIQSIDTAGNILNAKKYESVPQDFIPYDILIDDSIFYTVGYAYGGYRFDTDSIPPSSIFIAKYRSSLTNVSNINNLSSFKIYPNPTTGTFTLSLTENSFESIRIEIKDILGQTVYSRNYYDSQKEISLDLSCFSTGIYSVEISNVKTRGVKKIIVN